MRGRRTTVAAVVVAVVVAAVTAGCDDDSQRTRNLADTPTLNAADTGTGDPPELVDELDVELGTAVAVYGRGCRPQSPHQRCSPDGTKTYTLAGGLRAATVTGAWMELDTVRGAWVVRVRLAGGPVAEEAAGRAGRAGGLVVVVDAHTGNVLQAVAPGAVARARITVRDLQKPVAEGVVAAYVTAATAR